MIFYTLQKNKRPFILNFLRDPVGQVVVFKYNEASESDTCEPQYKQYTILPLTNNTKVFVNSSENQEHEATSILIQNFDPTNNSFSFKLFSGDRAISFSLPENDFVEKFFAKITNETPLPLIVGNKNVYFMAKDVDAYLPKNMIVGTMNDQLWENLYGPFLGNSNRNSNSNSNRNSKKLRDISSQIPGIVEIEPTA